MGVFSKLRYELEIINQTKKYFGFFKTIIFIIMLPLVAFTHSNATAWERLGVCDVVTDGKHIRFACTNPRFMEEIIERRCYNPLPEFNINEEYTVVDLGANVGIFTLLAASKAKHGKIFAIEPNINNYKCLIENVNVNNFSNVVPINVAIAESKGYCYLHITNPGSGSIFDVGKKGKRQHCLCKSMQEIIAENGIERIDFLKMDIEGAEFQVFNKDSWLDLVKLLVMEVHPRFGNIMTLVNKLEAREFKVNLKYDSDTLYLFAY